MSFRPITSMRSKAASRPPRGRHTLIHARLGFMLMDEWLDMSVKGGSHTCTSRVGGKRDREKAEHYQSSHYLR